jgi:hypothetical protein
MKVGSEGTATTRSKSSLQFMGNLEVLFLVALMLGIYRSSSLPALPLVLVLFKITPPLIVLLQFLQNLPSSLIVISNSEPTFIFDCYFKLICARPLPTYGVPGGMSNF